MAAPNRTNNRDETFMIALLGVTGAGKTTFVQKASGDMSLKIGHAIYSCTQEPQVVRFRLPTGESIALIDTPGFDDDTRSDVEILEQLARWMTEQGHMRKNQLDGIILLQPITAHRVGGTERKRTQLLKKILGEEAYKHVVIATTMWEQIKDRCDMEERLRGRRQDLWGDMVDKGTQIVEHANNKESAHMVIRKIVGMSDGVGKVKPLLQVELLKNPAVVSTTAGKHVKKQLEQKVKDTERQVKEHYRKRPSKPPRKDTSEQNARARVVWAEWLEDKKRLDEELALLELRLKRLNSLSFKLKTLWATLFGR